MTWKCPNSQDDRQETKIEGEYGLSEGCHPLHPHCYGFGGVRTSVFDGDDSHDDYLGSVDGDGGGNGGDVSNGLDQQAKHVLQRLSKMNRYLWSRYC